MPANAGERSHRTVGKYLKSARLHINSAAASISKKKSHTHTAPHHRTRQRQENGYHVPSRPRQTTLKAATGRAGARHARRR